MRTRSVIAALAVASIFITLPRRRERGIARVREREALRAAMARLVHQVRNPVQSILLHADILSQGAGASDEARAETCLAITMEAERLAAMLRDLAAFAAEPATRLGSERVPLHALLHDLGGGSAAGPPALEVVAVEGTDEVEIVGDAGELRRALEMLLANAREAVADRGHSRIVAHLARRGEDAEIELRDNGVGIPRDRLPRVFDPFVSSKPKAMGLGLTTAREIVERHGGRIAIESESGAGTRVRLLLPIASGAHARESPSILREVPAD